LIQLDALFRQLHSTTPAPWDHNGNQRPKYRLSDLLNQDSNNCGCCSSTTGTMDSYDSSNAMVPYSSNSYGSSSNGSDSNYGSGSTYGGSQQGAAYRTSAPGGGGFLSGFTNTGGGGAITPVDLGVPPGAAGQQRQFVNSFGVSSFSRPITLRQIGITRPLQQASFFTVRPFVVNPGCQLEVDFVDNATAALNLTPHKNIIHVLLEGAYLINYTGNLDTCKGRVACFTSDQMGDDCPRKIINSEAKVDCSGRINCSFRTNLTSGTTITLANIGDCPLRFMTSQFQRASAAFWMSIQRVVQFD